MTLTITSGATSPKPDGPSFLTEYSDHLLALYKMSARPLTSVAGTVNVVTATSATDFTTGGIVDGTKFTIEWAGTNTGAVTLNINSIGATPVIDKEGTALIAGSVVSGLRSLIEYVGGSFVILTEILASTAASVDYQEFTSSGTWTKPSGYDGNRMVVVECWGGGGAGHTSAGAAAGHGGGAGYARREFLLSDLPSSVAVTIGAGGTSGASGGSTTFGSLLTAVGGGGGTSIASGAGGGFGGGASITTSSTDGEDAGTMHGGGSGATGTTRTGGAAGFGGGGGGSVAGGASVYGGNGGTASAGSIPGGGGSSGGFAGARGELRVWIP